jgi:hypothetical protein
MMTGILNSKERINETTIPVIKHIPEIIQNLFLQDFISSLHNLYKYSPVGKPNINNII